MGAAHAANYAGHVAGAVREAWSGLIRIDPRRGDHRVALRAAVSVAVPLLVLLALGRLDLSIYASFGSFAALYGRHDDYADRIRMQAAAGVTLIAAMLLDTALAFCAMAGIVDVVIISFAAALITLLAYVWHWHPPGAIFVVFAVGACATLPATAMSFIGVLVGGGASVGFAVAVTTTLALLRDGLRRRTPRRRLPIGAVGWEMAITVGIGVLLAGAAALLIVGTHWYWAMIGAVAAVSGAHVTSRLIRGAQRLIGTLLGVLLAAGLLALAMPPALTIVVAIILQAGAELFIGRNYGIAMLFVTPLALLMVHLVAPIDPALLLGDRILDTVIGVVIGTLVAIVSAALRRPRAT